MGKHEGILGWIYIICHSLAVLLFSVLSLVFFNLILDFLDSFVFCFNSISSFDSGLDLIFCIFL